MRAFPSLLTSVLAASLVTAGSATALAAERIVVRPPARAGAALVQETIHAADAAKLADGAVVQGAPTRRVAVSGPAAAAMTRASALQIVSQGFGLPLTQGNVTYRPLGFTAAGKVELLAVSRTKHEDHYSWAADETSVRAYLDADNPDRLWLAFGCWMGSMCITHVHKRPVEGGDPVAENRPMRHELGVFPVDVPAQSRTAFLHGLEAAYKFVQAHP